MRGTLGLLLGFALMPVAFTVGAHAEGAAAPIHVATYVEVAAASPKNAIKLLKQYRDASRSENGQTAAFCSRPGPRRAAGMTDNDNL